MTIKTKLTFEEYKEINFLLTYKKPSIIFITIIGLIMLLISALIFFISGEYKDILPAFIFGIAVTFLIPYSVYSTSKRNFNSNKRIQEEIEYEFTNEKMKLKGESFTSELEWKNTNRIEELKNWFIIYQSKITANLIPKRNLSEKDIEEIRKIFLEQKNLKLKIKKNGC